MKQWAKTLLGRFSLSHIRWMIIGVMLTEFITWLLYKNPKKITAPGLSAIVAVCALILAVYSAYQVKKWINGKVNDKGFKKCESIIDKIQEIAMEMLKVNSEIGKLFQMNLVVIDESNHVLVMENLEKSIDNMKLLALELHTNAMHLNIWGFEIAENYNLFELTKAIGQYNSAIRNAIENSKNIINKKAYKEAIDDEGTYKQSVSMIGTYMDKINNSSFDEVFIPYILK